MSDTWHGVCYVSRLLKEVEVENFGGGREKEKGKREKKEKKKGGKKDRKEEEKGREMGEGRTVDGFLLGSSAFRRSELIRPRSKVHLRDEGYTPRCKDSSYFGLFSTLRAMWWCFFP